MNSILIEIGDRTEKGGAYRNLGNAYWFLADFQKDIEYYGKDLKSAKEIGDQDREGNASGSLGNAYHVFNG